MPGKNPQTPWTSSADPIPVTLMPQGRKTPEASKQDDKKHNLLTKGQHETASRSWSELLFSPAIDAPGRGWRITGFGLLLISLVMVVALLKAPAVFGGGAFAGGVWKVVKLVQKKPAPSTKPE